MKNILYIAYNFVKNVIIAKLSDFYSNLIFFNFYWVKKDSSDTINWHSEVTD